MQAMGMVSKKVRVRGSRGVSVVEYAILLGLIGALAIGATLAIGLSNQETFDTANVALEGGIASANANGQDGQGGGSPTQPPTTNPVLMQVSAPSGLVELTLYGANNTVIDWGGPSDCPTTPQTGAHIFITCNYTAPGLYDVSIGGTLNGFGFNNATISSFASGILYNIAVYDGGYSDTAGRAEIVSISDWGTVGLTRLDGMFVGSSLLQSLPASLPPTVISLNRTFVDDAVVPPQVASWDTSNIRELVGTFMRNSVVSVDLAGWDVSNVTHMIDTFSQSASNPNIGGWDVSSVRVMNSVFQDNTAFNRDISGWDVTNVVNYDTPGLFAFGSLFSGASAFNQDLSTWCVDDDVAPDAEVGVNYYFDSFATSWVLPRPNWGAPC
jgi:surface protein